MIEKIIIILAFLLMVALSGFFSGSETGFYRLSMLHLRLGVEKKRLSFRLLAKIMNKSSDLLLTLLIGNNLANYLATSAITFLLINSYQLEKNAEIFATLLTTPILFLYGELIPKNLYFYKANSLMPALSPLLTAFHKFFCYTGSVPLLRSICRLLTKFSTLNLLAPSTITQSQRSHINAIIQDTREEGFLSTVQSDIINRIVAIPNLLLKTAMVPLSKVQLVSINSNRNDLLEKLKKAPYSRWLVYDKNNFDIAGYINIYDCLTHPHDFTSLKDFIIPIKTLSCETLLIDAINKMQKENLKILLVTAHPHLKKQKPLGIVTMKDLVEEFLGELSEW